MLQFLLFTDNGVKVLEDFVLAAAAPRVLLLELRLSIIFILEVRLSQMVKILQVTKEVHIFH